MSLTVISIAIPNTCALIELPDGAIAAQFGIEPGSLSQALNLSAVERLRQIAAAPINEFSRRLITSLADVAEQEWRYLELDGSPWLTVNISHGW